MERCRPRAHHPPAHPGRRHGSDQARREPPIHPTGGGGGFGGTGERGPRGPAGHRAAGPMPVVTAYDDETAEAEGVASRLLHELESGRGWSDQAVLARTNDQLSVIGSALKRAGIPFRIAPPPEAQPGTRPD